MLSCVLFMHTIILTCLSPRKYGVTIVELRTRAVEQYHELFEAIVYYSYNRKIFILWLYVPALTYICSCPVVFFLREVRVRPHRAKMSDDQARN